MFDAAKRRKTEFGAGRKPLCLARIQTGRWPITRQTSGMAAGYSGGKTARGLCRESHFRQAEFGRAGFFTPAWRAVWWDRSRPVDGRGKHE